MSKVCDVCNKSYMKSNLVPTGIGGRVTRRTTKKQMPNLRNKKIDINGQKVKIKICASCLKRIKFEEKKTQAIEK